MDENLAGQIRALFAGRGAQKIVLIVVLLAVAYFSGSLGKLQPLPQQGEVPQTRQRQGDVFQPRQQGDVAARRDDIHREGPAGAGSNSDQVLADAFEHHARNVEVEGQGRVVRLLAEDDDGIRHQKFVLQLASGQELLVAHNIDLAAKVDDLRRGDTVEFRGEYEWNPQGGVLHWTHKDPENRHADGWLKHDGHTYQ